MMTMNYQYCNENYEDQQCDVNIVLKKGIEPCINFQQEIYLGKLKQNSLFRLTQTKEEEPPQHPYPATVK